MRRLYALFTGLLIVVFLATAVQAAEKREKFGMDKRDGLVKSHAANLRHQP